MAEEKKFRVESDLLGELKVPAGALYGVQTQRGINNYHISRKTMCNYPDFIIAIAYVKLAAIETNHTLGVINDEISGAISQTCREIIEGKWHENFPIDMIQGETINNMLKNTAQIVHSRHRSVNNFVMNLISALGAYCFFDNKPKALQEYCIENTKQLSLF